MMKLIGICLLLLVPQVGIIATQTPPIGGEGEYGICPDGKTMNLECFLAAGKAKVKADRDAAAVLAESMEILVAINQAAVAACDGDANCIAAANANFVTLSTAETLTFQNAKAANEAAFEVAALACCEDE